MAFTKALGGRASITASAWSAVNPGPVATDRMLKIMKRKRDRLLGDESRWEELFDKYPGKRPGDVRGSRGSHRLPRLRRASGYITGTVVTIDGGIAARGSVI